MTNKLSKEELVLNHIKELIIGTEYENHVFLVGGAVRDSLMGLPIKDIDLCIDLPNGGIEFATWIMKKVGQYKENVRPCVFPTYGTAMFSFHKFPDVQIECVQTRKEQYHDTNSRNPETAYGTLEEDCYRRDLTINSLYRNISTDEIIDITGKGLSDINNHIIQTPCDPDITFSDDPLRMCRVLRFSSRYGWDIEKNTLQGIIKNVDRIKIITQERITDELNKILLTKKPSVGLRLLNDTGLLKHILPELAETVGMIQNKYHFGDVFEHTLAVIDNIEPILEYRLAALFHDIGKIKCKTTDDNGNVHFYKHELVSGDLSEEIMKRMKYSNEHVKLVKKAVLSHMRTKSFGDDCVNIKDKSIRKLQYALGKDVDICLALIDADNKAHAPEHCMPNQVSIIKDKIKQIIEKGEDCSSIQLPINGNDIMLLLNIEPSPIIKDILSELTKQYIGNPIRFKNKDTCIKFVQTIYKKYKKDEENI